MGGGLRLDKMSAKIYFISLFIQNYNLLQLGYCIKLISMDAQGYGFYLLLQERRVEKASFDYILL